MITFRIPAMTCGHCASAVARAVASVDKDARLEVSIADKQVRIASSAAPGDLLEALADAGYPAEAAQAAPAEARAAGGGCCCGPRKSAAVDAGQAGAASGTSCCG